MTPYQLDPEAYADLNEILSYTDRVKGYDESYALEGLLEEAFKRLAAMPGLGHRRPDLTSKPLFFYPVDPYFIVYVRGDDPLRIVAIFHSRRNLRKLLRSR